MKKILALLLVIGMLAIAGSALAMEGVPGGHVEPGPTPPTPSEEVDTGETGSEEATVADDVQELVEEVTQEVVEVQIPPEAVVNQTTAEDLAKPAATAATDAVAALNAAGETVSETQAADYAAQAAALEANIAEKTADTSTSGSGLLAQLFGLVRSALNVANQALQSVTMIAKSALGVSNQPAQTVANAAVKLAQFAAQARADGKSSANSLAKQTVVGTMPAMAPTQTGAVTMPLPKFDKALYGKKPKFNLFKNSAFRAASVSGARISAADDDDGEALFMNSKSDVVKVIPNGNDGEIPGFLTVATFVEAGETYEPIISIANDDTAGEVIAVTTQTKSVDVVKTVASTFTPVETSKFTTFVDLGLINSLKVARSLDVRRFYSSDVSLEAWEEDDYDAAAKVANDGYDIYAIFTMNALTNNSADATFIVNALSFSVTSLDADSLVDRNNFYFYPDGIAMGASDSADVQVWKAVSGDINADSLEPITPRDLFASATGAAVTNGYVTFKMCADDEYTQPTLALRVVKASTPTPGGNSGDVNPTPGTSGDVNPTPGTSGDVNPTPTPGGNTSGDVSSRDITIRHGGSSGGCSTGFSIFGLLAISGLALLRKEK